MIMVVLKPAVAIRRFSLARFFEHIANMREFCSIGMTSGAVTAVLEIHRVSSTNFTCATLLCTEHMTLRSNNGEDIGYPQCIISSR